MNTQHEIADIPSLTNKEFFRMFGSLTGARIESVLDKEMILDDVCSIGPWISEGMSQFPEEDFLSDILKRLDALAKRMRGGTKAEMLEISEELRDVETKETSAAEYGRGELEKALDAIKESA